MPVTELIIRPDAPPPIGSSWILEGTSSLIESLVFILMSIAGFFPSRPSVELRLASLLRFERSEGVSVNDPGLLIADDDD